ncbi:putative phosphatidate phosphatase isoform X2 [Cotesia typhae]|uniref:putative phosphatidate phosphatase isoform X2 n=1 Tax=Cotesia typhae TaxID=2053667 RepID=UPI003D697DE8
MTKIFKSNGTKMIVDILCLLLLSAALVTVNFFMEPHKRGFFCDDQTLMYPYIAHTVFSTSKIIIAEIFLGRKNRRQPLKLFYYNIPNWGFFSYHTGGYYVIGTLTTLLIGDVMKYFTGRLRPNFMELCNPSINCSLPINQNRYITPEQFECTSVYGDSAAKEARLSFPSNHASCVAFFGVFLICYLQSRMTSSILKIPKHLLQAALVLMISFISMTRISNYRHHWSDVAAGILIGSANALITVFIMANLFKKDQPEKVEHDYQLDHEQQRDIDNYIEDRNNNTINVYPKMDVEMII